VTHRCPHCGTSLVPAAAYCHHCGLPRRDADRVAVTAARKRRRPPRPQREPLFGEHDGPETELWRDTFSAKGLVHPGLTLGTLTVGLPILAALLHVEHFAWLVLAVALPAAWLTLLVWLLYLKLNVYYVLTNQRLLHKHGVFTRHARRIEVIDIDDVSYRQRLLERLLGVGTIEIMSSDESDPVIELAGIDGVQQIAQLIDEARRAERVRRGIHIESV
jgi:uncharacterized membrane protein YdbT with pleckstrin-like domain